MGLITIRSNGKISDSEGVEAHYLKSVYIAEIVVVKLEACPGEDRLHAVVVPNFEVLKRRKIVNAKEVIRYDIEGLSAELPSARRIASYEIWQDALPRTTTRELSRLEIAKRVRTNQAEGGLKRPLSAEESAWLEQPDVRRAFNIMRQMARPSPQLIHPNDNLELALGLDSLQRVELVVALEQELGGRIQESRLAEIYTLRELVDAVRESASSGKGGPPRARFAGWKAVLDEPPADPEVVALLRSHPFKEAFWYGISRLLQVAARDRFRLRVEGLEKLPSHGPFIICSNHQSFIDPAVLASVLPWHIFRDSFAVGTSEIFGEGFMRVLARWLSVVVVDPDANLIPGMRAGAAGLRQGRVLVLYPEGERSIDGEPKIFKKGAAVLSIHLQAPIVPVAIDGFYEVWPRGKPFQDFTPLRMAFGNLIHPPPEAEASDAVYRGLAAEIKRRVIELRDQLLKKRQ